MTFYYVNIYFLYLFSILTFFIPVYNQKHEQHTKYIHSNPQVCRFQ